MVHPQFLRGLGTGLIIAGILAALLGYYMLSLVQDARFITEQYMVVTLPSFTQVLEKLRQAYQEQAPITLSKEEVHSFYPLVNTLRAMGEIVGKNLFEIPRQIGGVLTIMGVVIASIGVGLLIGSREGKKL